MIKTEEALTIIGGHVDEELLLRNEYLAKALRDVAMIVKPETILAWYRKLIASKFDSSKKRKDRVGRPLTENELEALVLKISRENMSWGYDRIVGALANLGYKISDQTVGNILKRHGISPTPGRQPQISWADFISIHQDVIIECDYGIKLIRPPPMSPNLNAYAERFVRTIKEECLSRLILFGENTLRRVLRTFLIHYH